LRSDSTGVARRVDGRVVKGTREGPQPVANQWVVLHRVGPDHAGPLDSVRTAASGHFRLQYRPSGDTTALYFASTSYGGVAYFTSPLRAPVVSGDDGSITVFDTTSGPVVIKVGGRHLIIGAPQANGRRPVGEVYDLENDSTVTLIARDTLSPVWSVHVPPQATAFQVNTSGDVAAGAIAHRGTSVGMFAPLSPGIRQLAFTYELPADAFPLSIPAERTTGVLELLVQEPSAKIAGATLHEMAPVTADGRIFRRFLAQDVPANTVIAVDLPKIIGAEREKVYIGVAITVLLAMTVALVFAARRRRPRFAAAAASVPESRSQRLIRELAGLDAAFEQSAPSEGSPAHAEYVARRTTLKAELADALAADRRSS
jgi:hypothetical protein